ncbi:cytoplasmic dynein 2 heavy chain 1 [Halyomorpha halys]|uniref:cytoplasmic dynein 2 heavy chain 1 n=1 Tax=Halyomorpha halys TaxID=286706 RepID=UPI0006D509B1
MVDSIQDEKQQKEMTLAYHQGKTNHRGVNETMQALKRRYFWWGMKTIQEDIGLKYILPPTLKLNEVFLETVATEPILIISSPGNDPSKDIFSLASANGNIKLHELAAGPGCEELILQALNEASSNGEWLMLKNLHLIIYWLPVFDREFHKIKPHKNFRIWLTTEPNEKFPPGFLNQCFKITYEAPPGIKRSMEKIYDNWSLDKELGVSIDASKVMFVLAWLHAVLQERRLYIPQGWTSYYEFNSSDLSCAKDIINRLFTRVYSDSFKWNYLQGLFEIVIYGGRICNLYDLRVLSTYLKQFFNNSVIEENFEVASGITIPKSANIKEHLDIIKRLPDVDSPEYFGLPKNANRIWQREASLSAILHLKALDEDKCFEETRNYKQEDSAVLLSFIKFWKNLKQGKKLIIQEFEDKSELKTGEIPISLFFALEKKFAQKLINIIDISLSGLETSLINDVIVDDSTALIANTLKSQQIPEMWEQLWNGPSNPLVYLQSVISKEENVDLIYNSWRTENIVFDLSQLYNIERFFAALKQQAARYFNTALEDLFLHTSIGKTTASIFEGSVVISGLLLEGAYISNNQLKENLEESPSVSLVPEILLSWKSSKENNLEDISYVSIPLYLTDRRDKVIADLLIPCKKQEIDKWILAGAAFYTKL